MKDEKDWSRATDYELIAEATKYIGKTATCLSDKQDYLVTGFDNISPSGKIWMYSNEGQVLIYTKRHGKWAEIVSPPKEARSIDFSDDTSDSFAYAVHSIPPEPKAGDMVEVKMDDWEDFDTNEPEEFVQLLSGPNVLIPKFLTISNGYYRLRDKIRLPQKSEVDSKANELLRGSIRYTSTGDERRWILEEDVQELLLEICKWGQQNPNKK